MPPVYSLDPLEDPRWGEFTQSHPAVSVFHTPDWLRALQRTYGYEPVVYTTSAPSAASLTSGVVLCAVRSWLTGRRLVSVPFADHCQPLADVPDDRAALAAALAAAPAQGWRYVELRPLDAAAAWDGTGQHRSGTYALHRLDLRRSLDEVFGAFHPSTIQRKIRRAERELLVFEEGRSDRLLEVFYRLLVQTRRRHGVPPQPLLWFRNLVDAFGERLAISVALKHRRPIAAIMTLRHRTTLVYKYGCSDAAFHGTGAMPALFWRAIQQARQGGVDTFDLGRSDLDNPGLITFKERLGAARSDLVYLRYPPARQPAVRRRRWTGRLVSRLPDALLVRAGSLLYRHMG